jgi:hypothetical protein
VDDQTLGEFMGAVKAKLDAIHAELSKSSARFDGHEQRLRAVERKVYLIFGLGTVGTAIASFSKEIYVAFGGGH